MIIGANVFFDQGETSNYHNDVSRLGLGAEILTEHLDFRINYYFADNDRHLIGEHKDSSTSSSSRIVGRSTSASAPTRGTGGLFQTLTTTERIRTTHTTTTRYYERHEAAMDGLDLELGGPVPWIDEFVDLRVYGGYYNFQNEFGGSDISGFKAHAEARLTPNLFLDAAYYEDERLTGSNWFFGARVSILIGRDGIYDDYSSPTIGGRRPLEERMLENVIRDPRIRSSESGLIENPKRRKVQRRSTFSKRSTTRHVPIGIDIDQDVIFVDSENPEIGDGSLENPFQSINLAESEASNRAGDGDAEQTIYVFSSDPGYDEAVIFDGTGIDNFRIDLLDSSNAITFNGLPLGGADPQAEWRAPVGGIPLVLTNLDQVDLCGFNITADFADALVANNVNSLTLNQTTLNSSGRIALDGPIYQGGNALNLTGVAEIRTNGIVINSTGAATGVRIVNSGRVGGSSVLDFASSNITGKSEAGVFLSNNIGNIRARHHQQQRLDRHRRCRWHPVG